MVTIEIHGIGSGPRGRTLAQRIARGLEQIPGSEKFLESQVRIVVVNDHSFDSSEKECPFIRLYYSSFPASQEQIDQSLEILRKFCSVEVIALYRFFTQTD